MSEIQRVPFAAGSGHLDRAPHLREMAEDLMRHRRAALLPLFQGKVLIDLSEEQPRLGWVPPLTDYLEEATEPPVFLGLSGETPCFAADFSAMDEVVAEEKFCGDASFVDLRSLAPELGPASAAIAATAKGVVGWHIGHMFCSRCGSRTEPDQGGWRRVCGNCGATHFPQTDPVVIMLILSDDNVLVARQTDWPEGLYSLLAGFMEPGETIEDAVRREAKATTGVEIGVVGYVGCQPWPFPQSLMIGCIAEAESKDLNTGADAPEDVQWISRAKMQIILEGKHPRMRAPQNDAIARAILTDWVKGAVRLP